MFQVQHELLLLPQGSQLFGRLVALVSDREATHVWTAAEQLLHLVWLLRARLDSPVGIRDLEWSSVPATNGQLSVHRLRLELRPRLLPVLPWLLIGKTEDTAANAELLATVETVSVPQLEQLCVRAYTVCVAEDEVGRGWCTPRAHSEVLPVPRSRVAQADAPPVTEPLHPDMAHGAREHARDMDQSWRLPHLKVLPEEQPLVLG